MLIYNAYELNRITKELLFVHDPVQLFKKKDPAVPFLQDIEFIAVQTFLHNSQSIVNSKSIFKASLKME